ncbi:MAG: 4Fe-4S binding protein [Desulfosudis oleivorans]|nr:4Fe-4S binding protein [Desulfosudis oleivorans]
MAGTGSSAAVVVEIGNSTQYETGSWRSERPVVEKEKCIKCMFCWLYCPEGCIHEAARRAFRGGPRLLQGMRDLRGRMPGRSASP